MTTKFENKFYKISHHGSTYVTGEFYNPVTKELKSELLADYDYADGSRDNVELYAELEDYYTEPCEEMYNIEKKVELVDSIG